MRKLSFAFNLGLLAFLAFPVPGRADQAPFVTQILLTTNSVVLRGTNGSPNGAYELLASPDLSLSLNQWAVLATNAFDADGKFDCTNPISPGQAAQFYLLLTGGSVLPPPVAPSINTQPTNLTVIAGQSALFSVGADGTAPLSYQWYFNTNTPLSGATNASFTVTNSQADDAGGYSVIVANVAGSATSAVATLTVLLPPSITAQPTNLTVTAGQNAIFNVTATGTAPLSYQWYFNTNTTLANATNSSFTITSAQSSNAGVYSVTITNLAGSTNSSYATLTVQGVDTNGAYFVSPSGNDTNPGTIDKPFKTITNGLAKISNNGLLYLRGGTYAYTYTLTLNKVGPTNRAIRVWAYPGEKPVIDNTGIGSGAYGINISGRCYHLKGIEQKNATDNGINISGHSNVIEFCAFHDNGDSGLQINTGTSGTTYPSNNFILNCDSYLNFDSPLGENADGFAAKWNLGPGNVFSGCRSWYNSDDGWDLWMGTSPVLITNCWAFWCGTNYVGGSGDGNGFKLGGNYVPAAHTLIHCVTFQNTHHGIDENNNTAALTVDQNTSWANGAKNFYLNHTTNNPAHIVRNNLSFAGVNGDTFSSASLRTNNSWQVISPAPSASDVQSVDTSLVTSPRQADGSLPVLPFLKPVLGGRLVNKGVIVVGEAYLGSAPDLGAYEVQ